MMNWISKIKQPYSGIIQVLKGVFFGLILSLLFAFLDKAFSWNFFMTEDLYILFLSYSLICYPIGVWAGIFSSGYIFRTRHYFWLSLAGLFLAELVFMLIASFYKERNFYLYWGIYYLLFPTLIMLGAYNPLKHNNKKKK